MTKGQYRAYSLAVGPKTLAFECSSYFATCIVIALTLYTWISWGKAAVCTDEHYRPN